MRERNPERASRARLTVIDRDDLTAEIDELVERDPAAARRAFVAIRALNRINRGEDPDAVIAFALPLLDGGDGLLS